jgi:hypothetical protein
MRGNGCSLDSFFPLRLKLGIGGIKPEEFYTRYDVYKKQQ